MGHMKDFDIRIRNGGDDAIAAVSELLREQEDEIERLRTELEQRRSTPVHTPDMLS